ncbi:uncharacterized protein LOC127782333 isoform X2 [Oryza glaberrima]|uniref:uncharacterized protein LOC127782333 isoform X2 n=1 Tax=Oryza glaberrima TaxID=4538 RepID=UPI00224BF328|nr:uncharacterized protein LOC127782333 isoform X2 [Oryza glaberrima]
MNLDHNSTFFFFPLRRRRGRCRCSPPLPLTVSSGRVARQIRRRCPSPSSSSSPRGGGCRRRRSRAVSTPKLQPYRCGGGSGGKTVGRWLKEGMRRRREETRAHNAQVHAAVSVAAVATTTASSSSGRDDRTARTNMTIPSAAKLFPAQCVEAAESLGAERDHLTAAVAFTVSVRLPATSSPSPPPLPMGQRIERRGDGQGEGVQGRVERGRCDPRREERRRCHQPPPTLQTQRPEAAASPPPPWQRQQHEQQLRRRRRRQQLPHHLQPRTPRPWHRLLKRTRKDLELQSLCGQEQVHIGSDRFTPFAFFSWDGGWMEQWISAPLTRTESSTQQLKSDLHPVVQALIYAWVMSPIELLLFGLEALNYLGSK